MHDINWEVELWQVLIIGGLTLITLITRCFFFISTRQFAMPAWVERALQYAPIAAMAAVILPEIMAINGVLLSSWWDPKIVSTGAAVLWFVVGRVFFGTASVMGSIFAGSLAFALAHLLHT